MTTPRTAACLRAFAKPLFAGALVLFLFVSALASASPELHHCLHSDHQTPSHCCLVTVLELGHTDAASIWISPMPAAAEIAVASLPCESFFVSHDLTLHPERGPPVLS